jgi:hypothetical protein
MAIVSCRECGKEISTRAEKCPHCGVVRAGGVGLGWKLALPAIVFFIVYLLKGEDPPAAPPATATAAPTVTAAATEEQQAQCEADAKCFAEKHAGDAVGPCRRSVEALAPYDFQWMQGQKFSVFERYPDNPTIITYSGDRIRFQNAVGAWQVMTYACDFNVVSGKAIEARVDPK